MAVKKSSKKPVKKRKSGTTKATGRNYRSEYDNYHKKPAQRKRNNSRKRARYASDKAGTTRKGDGQDLHHANGNPNDNRKSNLKVVSKRKNRSYARTKTARKKNPRA